MAAVQKHVASFTPSEFELVAEVWERSTGRWSEQASMVLELPLT